MLLSTFKQQLVLMINRKGFKIAMTLMMLYAVVIPVKFALKFKGMYTNRTLDCDSMFFLNEPTPYLTTLFLIFLVIIVMCNGYSFFVDNKLRISNIYMSKVGKKSYFIAQYITCFVAGIIIIVIPSVVNIIINTLFFYHTGATYSGTVDEKMFLDTIIGTNVNTQCVSVGMPFVSLYLKSAFWYNILFMFIFALFAACISVFSYAISLYINTYKILVAIPGVVMVYAFNTLENLLQNKIPYTAYALIYYLTINTSPGRNYLLLILLLISMLIFSSFVVWIKIREDYSN